MAVRSTMTTLIGYVRDMINDPSSGGVFGDQQVQDRLDDTREFVNYSVLRVEPTLTVGGILAMSDFFADTGFWEDSPATQVYSPSFAVLTPLEADTLTGHWRFSATPPGQIIPVLVRGYYYDVNRAAAALCIRWANKVALSYDISSGSQRLARSQMRTALLDMAKEYRLKSRPRTVPMIQQDEANGSWPTQNDDAFPWTW